MPLNISLDVDVLEYDGTELKKWKEGKRDECSDEFCRRFAGTSGFGEYIVGRHFEEQGYKWIHHDFDLFGTNKEAKYPKSEKILMDYFGEEKLLAMRSLHKTLFPFREPHHYPLEAPDLLIFKSNRQTVTEVRFAESKRLDTRDKLNRRQVLGLFLIDAVLKCPIQVFIVRERGSSKSTRRTLDFPFNAPAQQRRSAATRGAARR